MNTVLKKKAFTAVLTAAFVFGIGGIVIDFDGAHEHEIGIAHAAQAFWRCYWCGKKATTNSTDNGYAYAPSRAGCPSESATKKWSWYYGHAWICEAGPALPSPYTVHVCRSCGRVHVTERNGEPPQVACDSYPDQAHRWTDRGIQLYGPVNIHNKYN